MLDVLAQARRRDRKAAKRLLRKLLKRQARAPRVPVTDRLKSYAAAKRELGLGGEHRRHKGLDNRAENSHQPTRRRERQEALQIAPAVQRFPSVHDQVANLFLLHRDHVTAAQRCAVRARAFETWSEVTGARLAA
jgi:putative transposase